jgi:hypothetical protein
MKHLSRITVAAAKTNVGDDTEAILAQIFAFVLEVIDVKGKGGNNTAA